MIQTLKFIKYKIKVKQQFNFFSTTQLRYQKINTITSSDSLIENIDDRLKVFKENKMSPYPSFKHEDVISYDKYITTSRLKSSTNLSSEINQLNTDKAIPFNDIDLVKAAFENSLNKGEKLKEMKMDIAGRVIGKREASNKLIFYDVQVNHKRIQVVSSKANFSLEENENDFIDRNKIVKRGDIAKFRGFIGKTNVGTLSLFATRSPEILSACLQDLPLPNKLGSVDKRYRHRYLDFILDPKASEVIKIRSKVINYIRRYLDEREFIEVETPILANKAGGANAKPFITTAQALDNIQLHLRIAPELYLKQMVIGGFDRVYELGKVFRNESMDTNHNPEFTTCEFYMAYANLDALFDITEDMLRRLVKTVTGSYQFELKDNSINSLENDELRKENSGPRIINFEPNFRRIHIVEELERCLKTKLPDLNGPVEPFVKLCNDNNIKLTGPKTLPRVLDKLIGYFIEPQCFQPTFLYGHPLVMSPLAKANGDMPHLSSRFELFINFQEFANAYEELNDPTEQRNRFLSQVKDREVFGDNEAQVMDEDFCNALSYGLPPTAGWGLGIDRLVTLLSSSPTIRSTLTFPLMKPL